MNLRVWNITFVGANCFLKLMELCLPMAQPVCAVVFVSPRDPAEPKHRFRFNYLLNFELVLNSLQDLNHIFLFLIRMLCKECLQFPAVCISPTFTPRIAGRGSYP